MIGITVVVIILFALFAWSRAALRLRDKNITLGEFIFWSIIWAVVILVSLFQDILSQVSSVVGIGRGTDLAVYLSIIVLFYLLFRIYVFMDEQNKQITKLVRQVAIRDAKKKK